MTWPLRGDNLLGCIVLLAACGSDDSVGSGQATTTSTESTGQPTDPGHAEPEASTSSPTGSTSSTSSTDSTGLTTSAATTSGDTSTGPIVGDALCGNGVVDADENCDLGENNVPEGKPVEYGCGDHCQTWLYCGDGIVQEPHEDCDKKDSDGFCTESCQDIYLIFLTSEQFSGNLGGTTGADQKCTAAGSARVPNGVFKAWLVGPGETIESRFGMFYPLPQEPEDVIRFRDPSKLTIVESFQELTFSSPEPIVRTELYTEVGTGCPEDACDEDLVWSNVDGAGNDTGTNCSGWASSDSTGNYGKSSLPDQKDAWEQQRLWTNFLMEKRDCREKLRLYCIQVGFKDE